MRWPSPRAFSGLLDLLYESAVTPAFWEDFLAHVSEVISATRAAVLFNNFEHQQYNVAFEAGWDSASQQLYRERVGGEDVFVKRAISKFPSGWIGIGQSLVSDEELPKTHVYNEFMRLYDVFHECGSLVTYDGSICQCVTFLRPKKLGQFSKAQVDLLCLLVPHIRRAFRLHSNFTDLRAAAETLQRAIDSVSTAIILLDGTGRVIHSNPSAERILVPGEGLVLRQGRVHAENPEESRTLSHMISAALALDIAAGQSEIGTVLVHRKKGQALRVLVSPLRSDTVLPGKQTAAAIFIIDPERRIRPPVDLIRSLYGLTPAESRIALLMSDGRPLQEICNLLGISQNTLKTHVQAIYGKTGMKRQSELVRTFMQLPTRKG